MINKVDAIRSLFKGLYHKATADKIVWKDGHTTTDEENSQIDAEFSRLQTEYDAQEYARKREAEYPSVQDLVVALYDTEDKLAIETKRAEVKAKYPKS
jgi:hypothetical protein